MTRVYQTNDCEADCPGNCWPAALASILDLTLNDTRHLCAHADDFRDRTQAFLAERGLFYLEVPIETGPNKQSFPFTLIPKGALFLGSDKSRRFDHAVVLRSEHIAADEMVFYIVHDPARPDGSMRGDYQLVRVIFLCRLFQDGPQNSKA